jgi:uncharacterized glyoxalase superfamily protein PhnB
MRSAIPILAYLDGKQTAEFYRKIGFNVNDTWDGYIMCSRDNIEIHLWRTNDPELPKQTGCYVRVEEIDSLYQEMSDYGVVHPNGHLQDKPWKQREFAILDNSGNVFTFGQSLV